MTDRALSCHDHDTQVNYRTVQAALRASAKPSQARILQSFFKTGPGEYGEGDVFLGVRVGDVRKLIPRTDPLSEQGILRFLRSKYHEDRMVALMILSRRFERGDTSARKRIFDLYLRHTRFINNWDLVDFSAPNIVGAWLLDKPRGLLRKLARSDALWERRIAVLATYPFIRAGQFQDTLTICRLLLRDRHDLIHKATGWMLREVGNQDVKPLEEFLQKHAKRMPRTMLRYTIERFPEAKRRAWLKR